MCAEAPSEPSRLLGRPTTTSTASCSATSAARWARSAWPSGSRGSVAHVLRVGEDVRDGAIVGVSGDLRDLGGSRSFPLRQEHDATGLHRWLVAGDALRRLLAAVDVQDALRPGPTVDDEALARLREGGVGLSSTIHPTVVRAVTHLDLDDVVIERAIELAPHVLGIRAAA